MNSPQPSKFLLRLLPVDFKMTKFNWVGVGGGGKQLIQYDF